MQSGNPVLRADTFRGLPRVVGDRMTIQGTVTKTVVLLLLAMVSAGYTWHLAMDDAGVTMVPFLLMVGTIGGLVLGLVTAFKKEWSRFLAPAYALCEGLALGGISAFADQRLPGVVMPAVGLTLTTLLGMLAVYSSGLIRMTDRFRLGVASATAGIMLFYVINMALGFFHIHLFAGLAGSTIGLAIQIGVVAIAALNLVIDFDFIDSGARSGAPRYMEWYGAFGLMVTLVWLYLEILRLLSRLQERR